MTKTYRAVFTQYIAPEHGDGVTRYYVQKEMDIPFIPTEKMGFILPDLGRFVLHTSWVHYDFNDEKFYITLQANWIQIWDDREYLYEDTITMMKNYVELLRKSGWTVTEKESA